MRAIQYNMKYWILIILVVAGACTGDTIEGDRFFKKGEYEKAIQVYNEHLDTNPSHIKSLYNRGRSYEELGQFKEAIEDFEQVLKVSPGNANALLSLASISLKQNDPANAVYYAEQAVESADDNPSAYLLRGRGYHKQGKLEEALDDYNSAINLDKSIGQAYLYRGALKISMKRGKSGCSDLRIARSLNVPEAENALSKYCN